MDSFVESYYLFCFNHYKLLPIFATRYVQPDSWACRS